MTGARVTHFAGHAVDNRANPSFSSLLLTPAGAEDNGALRAEEIAVMKLQTMRLVVLAACDTAEGPVSPGEGLHSLARSFLEAGVPNVVATLWQIDDEPSAALFERFHAEYALDRDPARALRAAQVALLRSGNPALSNPRAWAGVVVMGAVMSGLKP